jgi:UDPglucose 6-dehydrogenase
MVKYAHNVFGALKVTYFNCIYDLCQKLGMDYERVRAGILGSTYINEMHTKVPGPDGKLGYGGKCVPKDVNAFTLMTKGTPLGELLAPLHRLNVGFRGFEERI